MSDYKEEPGLSFEPMIQISEPSDDAPATRPNVAPQFPDIDRDNYPRPQFYRADYTMLNGQWGFEFADGMDLAKLADVSCAMSGEITVPFPYQSKMSGLGDTSPEHEYMLYKKDFQKPASWQRDDKDYDYLLHFERIDYETVVLVNGQIVPVLIEGKPHERNVGGQVPFTVDLTPYLKNNGEMEQIGLAVTDKNDRDQPRGKQVPSPANMWYTNVSGIHGDVWVERVAKQHFDRDTFKMETSAQRREIQFDMPLAGVVDGATVDISIFQMDDPKQRIIAQGTTSAINGVASMAVALGDDAALWAPSPEQANLYEIQLNLKNEQGEIVDQVRSYAGLCDVETKEGSYFINGKPFFGVGTLYQPWYPDSLLAEPSGEAVKRDVVDMVDMGYNLVRPHQVVASQRLLWQCDRHGIAAWGEMANAQTSSPESQRRSKDEFVRAVGTYRNHPSIVTYVYDNESFGCPMLEHGCTETYAVHEQAVEKIQALDPKRPCMPNEGWEFTENTGVIGIHDYSATGEELKSRYRDFANGKTMAGRAGTSPRLIMACGARYQGQPVGLSEYDGAMHNSPEESGMGYVCVSSDAAYQDKHLEFVEAIKDIPVLAFVVDTQFCDVENEKNGRVSYDRQKYYVDPQALKKMHLDLCAHMISEAAVLTRKEQSQAAARSAQPAPV